MKWYKVCDTRSLKLVKHIRYIYVYFCLLEKLVVKTILAKSRCNEKNCKDMKYEEEWLLECLLVRVKTPAVYDHLRENNIIPLPCKDILRKLTSCLSTEFGFNDFAMESI